jgi:hypothetical protein
MGDIMAVIRSCTAYLEPPWTLLAGNLLAKHSPVECRGIVHILTSEGFQGAPERLHPSVRWDPSMQAWPSPSLR